MPSYEVEIPGVGNYEIESESPLTDAEIRDWAMKNITSQVFPLKKDMGELSQAGLNRANSLKSFSAYMTTTDPQKLQNILTTGDLAIPGALKTQDPEGNPGIVIDGKPFYLNKPGMSGADAFGFFGDLVSYIPAGKLASIFNKGYQRMFAASIGTGGTTALKEMLAQQFGSEEPIDTTIIALDAVFGGAGQRIGDALSNYVASRKKFKDAAGNYTDDFKQALKEAGLNLEDITKEGRRVLERAYQHIGRNMGQQVSDVRGAVAQAEADVFQIPLTKGQRTGDIEQLGREESMRKGVYGEIGQKRIGEIDVAQKEAIEAGVQKVGETFSTAAVPVNLFADPFEGANSLVSRLQKLEGVQKEKASELYDLTKVATLEVIPKAITDIAPTARRLIQEADVDLSTEITPVALQMMNKINQFSQKAKPKEPFMPTPDVKTIANVPIKELEAFRRQLAQLGKNTKNASDSRAATQIMQSFDDWLEKSIDDRLIVGEATDLETLKEARSFFKQYATKFREKGGKSVDAQAQKLITKMLDPNLTASDSLALLFGRGRIGEKSVQTAVIKKLQNIFQDDPEALTMMRQTALLRLVQDGRGQMLSSKQMVNRIDDLLKGGGKEFAEVLLNDSQRETLQAFRNSVSRTIIPEEAMNPSKTAYALARLAKDVFSALGFGARMLAAPMTAGGSEVARAVGRRRAVTEATTPVDPRALRRQPPTMPIPFTGGRFGIQAPTISVPLSVGAGGLLSTPDGQPPSLLK